MILTIDKNISVEVVRSRKRKTASIQVNDGLIKAIVPEQLPALTIAEIIRKRASWIRRKLHEQSLVVVPSKKEFVSGESITYLGRDYRLKVSRGIERGITLQGKYLEVKVSADADEASIRKVVVNWYKRQAQRRLAEKSNRYAKIMRVAPNSISVKDYKARWGSCSTKGDISFNWRIIMAPHHIVDYVVIHELCHLKHHNHSPDYWRAVRREYPDYEASRQWLKYNANQLII